MLRKIQILVVVIGGMLVTTIVSAQTVIPGGYVSGIWAASGSPYLVEGEITVHSDSTLNIEPGVEVIFQGHYRFFVWGYLEAVGTEQDSILFTAADTSEGWHSIRFIYAQPGGYLSFCIIQYGRATGYSPYSYGGGIYSISSDPVIDHCTIQNNYAGEYGGGIHYCGSGSPRIDRCTIRGNSAEVGGGGILCSSSSGENPIVSNCTIGENSSRGKGGGIYSDGDDTCIDSCTISANSASTSGGGMYCSPGASPTINNCVFSTNSAGTYGGGIAAEDAAGMIENSVVSNNRADSSGGGIRCWNSSPTVENCTFDGNHANVWGGGISIVHNSDPIIQFCTFSGNSADGGAGGIGCYDNCHPTLDSCTVNNNTTNASGGGIGIGINSNPTIIECSISENSANEDGGGINCFANSNPTISHCTVSDNSAEDDGGGMCIAHNCSDLIVSYCTISGNSAHDGGGIFCDDYSSATIDSCTISRNLAYHYGGGVYCYDSYATIENCTISMNSALDDCGGGICCDNSEATIENCTIRENFCYYGGSGIHAYASNATIYNCTISENLSFYGSGGIHAYESNATIYNCTISGNSGEEGGGIYCDLGASLSILNCTINGNSAHNCGGGIYCYDSEATIENCTIRENSAGERGGGISCYYSSPTIENCTISGNSTTGLGNGINIENCSPSVVNTVVTGNTGGEGGIYFEDCPSVSVSYGDCYDNQNGNYAGAVPIGLGELAALNANGDSCDVFYNICLDPLFVYPDQNDYRLQWGSPCIDAGDPDPIYNDPDGTIAEMGAWYYDQSIAVRILLTPRNAPIVIPPEGGSFDYTIRATSIVPALLVNIWCDVTLPDQSIFGPVLGPVSVTLDSGITISRERSQTVPAGTPVGTYSYNAYAVAGVDTSRDSFTFVKLDSDGLDGLAGWFNAGESFEDIGGGRTPALPGDFALLGAFPNPFNPVTNISLTLPEAMKVYITVYDISGRRVEELVNGWRDAGSYEVTFDGSRLASGIYIYRLKAGNFTASGKMVLMK